MCLGTGCGDQGQDLLGDDLREILLLEVLAVLNPALGCRKVAGETFAVLDFLELVGDTPNDVSGHVEPGQVVRDRTCVGIVERLDCRTKAAAPS